MVPSSVMRAAADVQNRRFPGKRCECSAFGAGGYFCVTLVALGFGTVAAESSNSMLRGGGEKAKAAQEESVRENCLTKIRCLKKVCRPAWQGQCRYELRIGTSGVQIK